MSPLAVAPALPLHKAGPYVAAAYIVFLAVVLIYVAIMGIRLTRSQRDLAELKRELQERELTAGQTPGSGQSPAPDQPPGSEPDREVTPQL